MVVAHFSLAEQNAAVHGFEAIAHIRQGTRHDDAHGVGQIGLLHFRLDGDGLDGRVIEQVGHGGVFFLSMPRNLAETGGCLKLWVANFSRYTGIIGEEMPIRAAGAAADVCR